MFYYLNFVAIFQLVFYIFFICVNIWIKLHIYLVAIIKDFHHLRFSWKKTNILSNNLGMTRRQIRILDQLKYRNIMVSKNECMA